MPKLSVHYLPQFVAEHELADAVVVVIDQLRASSTVCHALAAGAVEVRPLVEVDAVLREVDGQERSQVLLGGERGGKRIEGFDLGNSPAEYTADVVFGKRIYFTTTNGTRAINHARLASRVLMAAACNLSAVVDELADENVVHLLCAGTGGHVSRDDLLVAGALAHEFSARGDWRLNEGAQATRGEWQELLNAAAAFGRSTSEQLALELQNTPGGKNLMAIGHDDDLVICGDIDSRPVVPELDRSSGCLVL
ncbi:2-phosphosulfolactate phosphatase [Aeoliella mucimassa]|uniref:Probable 2-phosphosulfolactate phosphatase n=1 Tax=Aeoliella mucimassa TaxID=2527972 RepID=A0A518AI73_9BACT|nr:2-phosphosulfolactate phosphatase [Aeoliella mucimassa]QDU54416.1 putative 2-phosphosulfolactate phosphatase [Aeoliella mucimassa]